MLTMLAVATEIQPGVLHWTAVHPRIKQRVGSLYVTAAATLIDPMIPDEGLDWFGGDGPPIPQRIVLSNRHHLRDSAAFEAEFGCSIHCLDAGLHEFANGPDVEAFFIGDEVAPGVVVHEMGAICPDDTALHIDAGSGVLAFADAVIHFGGEVGFVPDSLMDDPPNARRGVIAAARELCGLDFDALAFAHGDPIPSGGKRALEDFVARNS
jgi:hypothetical protein